MKKRVAPRVAILSTGDQPNDSVLVLLDGGQYWWGTRKQAGCPTMFKDLIWGFAQFLHDSDDLGDGVAKVVEVTFPCDFMVNGMMPEGYESEDAEEHGDWTCLDVQEWFNHYWVPRHGVEVPLQVVEKPPIYRCEGDDHRVYVLVHVSPEANIYETHVGVGSIAYCRGFLAGLVEANKDTGYHVEAVTEERFDEVEASMRDAS